MGDPQHRMLGNILSRSLIKNIPKMGTFPLYAGHTVKRAKRHGFQSRGFNSSVEKDEIEFEKFHGNPFRTD